MSQNIVKLVTNNEDLIPSRNYWVREINNPNAQVEVAACGMHDGWKFLMLIPKVGEPWPAERVWAKNINSQALKRWEIVGPIPEMDRVTFESLIKDDL